MKQLTRKQQSLIINMLSSASVDDACRASAVSRSTAYRWMKDSPEFRSEWADAKTQAFSEAISVLARASTTFANVLESIATDPTAPMTARVSACRAGLEWSTRGIETEAIAADARELAQELRQLKAKK